MNFSGSMFLEQPLERVGPLVHPIFEDEPVPLFPRAKSPLS